jgi:hypothetical protein
MTLKEIAEILEGEILCTGDNEDLEITSACGSDLMSDVMAFVKNSAMLLTGLLNMQVIRTAEMMDMRLIVFKGRGQIKMPDIVQLYAVFFLPRRICSFL